MRLIHNTTLVNKECPRCNSTFEYGDSDIQIDYPHMSAKNIGDPRYSLLCPACKFYMSVEPTYKNRNNQ